MAERPPSPPSWGEEPSLIGRLLHSRGWQAIWGERNFSPFSSRQISHLAVILLIILVISLGKANFSYSADRADLSLTFRLDRMDRLSLLSSRGGPRPQSEDTLVRAPVPLTITSEPAKQPIVPDLSDLRELPKSLKSTQMPTPELRRRGIITYTVQTGDTLYGLAQKFSISADTIMWANGRLEDHPDLLEVGQVLTILPVDGIYHTVQKGETLASIAKKYKVDVSAILECEYNNLEGADIVPGQKIIVPGGKKPYKPRVVHVYKGPIPKGAAKGTGAFVWPTSGVITQKFWARHKAIDIGAPTGTPVVAADSGYVVKAGWSKYGYGNYIVIDHGNGFQTLYAHLSAILVQVGQSVAKGTRIGSVGSTGRSTGPHLHFEIRYNGVQRNPLGYLP